ncbi:16S rRNA (cytidine(1402)-2'-O)-methyltransferase [Alkalibacter saccharofermentans]|uniref:Ribosomal RNA small subunit methyltransferase I n=1 Tax=Alkalibacter saccharofermentans DSM 14828 TaxID=1120975 RepID=A0A1M4T427_9FIRM|nr:16S rRNA (cytidine(1402)-2'-O)-methyltransferase [Alkalibacter saccharofermentans]SHE39174.1 16S rRNA (cytidine1402-2'-O)-methyltransferase [Alkalibacter saccharofermentans DSM 14828]
MYSQADKMKSAYGICYLVATPIGNLEDMSFRAVRILAEADLIAAEDTRHTKKLLNHYDIGARLISYHQHNEIDRSNQLVEMLKEGQTIAIVSDAGTPGISDPGAIMARRCHEEGINITVIPGACAAIGALVVSGMSTDKFSFCGFLPSNKKSRKKALEEIGKLKLTVILYEAPHRLIKTLKELEDSLGDREITLVKELTKLHETIWKGSISRAIIHYEENLPKGEFVLLIEGSSQEEKGFWDTMTLEEHMEHYLEEGISKKEAVKLIAKDRGIPKREVYDRFMT